MVERLIWGASELNSPQQWGLSRRRQGNAGRIAPLSGTESRRESDQPKKQHI